MSGRVTLFAALLLAGTGTAGCTPEPNASAAEPQAIVEQAGGQQAPVKQQAPGQQAAAPQEPGQQAGAGHSVFSCQLGGGKIVTVRQDGLRFVYRYGTAGQAELTIEGTPANGRVFQQTAVHGGTNDVELRFVSDEYSYVVHSFPRSDIVDNVPRSGLRVYRGGTKIMDRSCSPWAALSFEGVNSVHDLPGLPEGAPDAWEN